MVLREKYLLVSVVSNHVSLLADLGFLPGPLGTAVPAPSSYQLLLKKNWKEK